MPPHRPRLHARSWPLRCPRPARAPAARRRDTRKACRSRCFAKAERRCPPPVPGVCPHRRCSASVSARSRLPTERTSPSRRSSASSAVLLGGHRTGENHLEPLGAVRSPTAGSHAVPGRTPSVSGPPRSCGRCGRGSGGWDRAEARSARACSSGSNPLVMTLAGSAEAPLEIRSDRARHREDAIGPPQHGPLEAGVGRRLKPGRPCRTGRIKRPAVPKVGDPGRSEGSQGRSR